MTELQNVRLVKMLQQHKVMLSKEEKRSPPFCARLCHRMGGLTHTHTHTDEHGNVVKMSYVGGPPMTAEGQEADDEPPPPPPPVSPTPPGAAQNRRRIFHEYRDKKAQKRPAEDPPDDPRAA